MIGIVKKSLMARMAGMDLTTMSDDELIDLRADLAEIRDEAQRWLTDALNEKHARLTAETERLRAELAEQRHRGSVS